MSLPLNPLIIALDTSSTLKALHLVSRLKVAGVAFKVGYELFTAGGPRIIKNILNHHVRVFLDLKFHDIPNTVSRASALATKMGVWMFNVHTSGGSEMMRRAKEASLETADKRRISAPLVLGVTVLTSLSSLDELNFLGNVENQVVHLAKLAKNAGLDGVVASAREAPLVSRECGENFCIVTPGIRMPEDAADDQKRTLTPREAMQNGSHYLVVGRPVTGAFKPLKMIEKILESL